MPALFAAASVSRQGRMEPGVGSARSTAAFAITSASTCLAKKTSLAPSSFSMRASSLPARAQEDPLSFDVVFKMADKNKDGMVSKPEFMEAMGKAYDMKMSKMKSMKDDKMMKGDAMTRDGYKSLIADIYKGA